MVKKNCRTHPRNVLAAQRRVRALELRIAGKSMTQIAETLEVHPVTAQKLLSQALTRQSERERELSEHHKTVTHRRLEKLLEVQWEKAQGGNTEALKSVLSIIDREMKLWGLDQTPHIKLNQVNVVNLPPEELLRRARMMGLELPPDGPPQLAHDPNVIDAEVVSHAPICPQGVPEGEPSE